MPFLSLLQHQPSVSMSLNVWCWARQTCARRILACCGYSPLGRGSGSASLPGSHPGCICPDHLEPLSLTCISKVSLVACVFCVSVAFGWVSLSDCQQLRGIPLRNNSHSPWLMLDLVICDRCSTVPDLGYFPLLFLPPDSQRGFLPSLSRAQQGEIPSKCKCRPLPCLSFPYRLYPTVLIFQLCEFSPS